MQTADAVLRFLESIGRGSEAQFYLRLFRAESKEAFALLSIDGPVIRGAAAAVEMDLEFLSSLGLVPCVVLGVLDPAPARQQAQELHARLSRARVPSTPIDAAVTSDSAALVAGAARAGSIPIVTLGAEPRDPDERFARLGALAAALRTRKLVFLARSGGLRARGEALSLVNVAADAAALLEPGVLPPKKRTLLSQSVRLLEQAPGMTIAVTSPILLLRELFTVKGAGTLLRRGATVERRRGWEEVDRSRLLALLQSSFGREPLPAFFDRPIDRAYLVSAGDAYRGAALIAATPFGSYLSKFAVERQAQGEGIGRDIWREVVADHPALFWRGRTKNAITPFYVEQCDGLARRDGWTVYWRGLPGDRIPAVIEHTLALPRDLPEPAPTA